MSATALAAPVGSAPGRHLLLLLSRPSGARVKTSQNRGLADALGRPPPSPPPRPPPSSPPPPSPPPPFRSAAAAAAAAAAPAAARVAADLPPDQTLEHILLTARIGNPLGTARAILRLARRPGKPLPDLLLGLPACTFTELLRSLDPFLAAPYLDNAHGSRIPPGLGGRSHVARLNNAYGVRRIHVALLGPLVDAFRARVEAGRPALPDDYRVLLRCAGAAQDRGAAVALWKMMHPAGHVHLRHIGLYTEYVRARLLTEPLYYQHDRDRVRLRPGDLHQSATMLPWRVRRKLDNLRMRLNSFRTTLYGILNDEGGGGDGASGADAEADGTDGRPNRYTLSRKLRLRRPPRRSLYAARKWYGAVDEGLVCAIMVALGRTGSRQLVKGLLRDGYGIVVTENWSTMRVSINRVPKSDLVPPFTPSPRLLHAIAESWGSADDIQVAVRLLGFIHAEWAVPITHDVWSALLQWAYISASTPSRQEWEETKTARPLWRSGPVRGSDVKLVWDTMTAPPYSVSPSWQDYDVHVKSLIEMGRLSDALEGMIKARHAYDALMRDNMEAFYLLHEHAEPGSDGDGAGRAHGHGDGSLRDMFLTNWQTTRFQLDLAQNMIRLWVRKWLKEHSNGSRPRKFEHEKFRLVPRLVLAFRPWLPHPVGYRTDTGAVKLYALGDPWRRGAELARAEVAELEAAAKFALAVGEPDEAATAGSRAEDITIDWGNEWDRQAIARTELEGLNVPYADLTLVVPPPTLLSRGSPGNKVTYAVGSPIRRRVLSPKAAGGWAPVRRAVRAADGGETRPRSGPMKRWSGWHIAADDGPDGGDLRTLWLQPDGKEHLGAELRLTQGVRGVRRSLANGVWKGPRRDNDEGSRLCSDPAPAGAGGPGAGRDWGGGRYDSAS